MHHSQKPSYMVQRLYVWSGQGALVGSGLFTTSVRFWSNPLHIFCGRALQTYICLRRSMHHQPQTATLCAIHAMLYLANTGTRFKIDIYKLYPKSYLNKVLKDIQRDCIGLKMYLGCTYRGCVWPVAWSKTSAKLSFYHSNFYQQSRQTSGLHSCKICYLFEPETRLK